jgi:hypothetical protein
VMVFPVSVFTKICMPPPRSRRVVGDAVFSARVVDDAVFSALTVKGLAMAGGYISAHSAVGASAHGGGTSWLSRFRYSPS